MTRFYPFAVGVLTLAAAVGAQEAKEAPIVKDDAKLFKAETIKKAEAAARDLAKKGIRLVIETYPTLPPGMSDKVKEMSAKDRDAAFNEWSRTQLKKLGPATFQIVLTDNPKHLQVAIGPDVVKKGFTPQDRQALTRAMLDKLRNKQIDEALEGALATLRKRFDAPSDGACASLGVARTRSQTVR